MTAHPDDENNAALALYARHVGARVALVTATRGDGGQNEIGTELFDALGILRTEELLAAHRFDGAEQSFTRAVDFGYSFSPEETLEKWGRQEILGDFVRHIRTLRPDVIVSMSPEGTGGGQHHQASAVLAADAFRAAADPAQFPEQIRDGLRPWQALKLYRPAGGFGGRGGRGGPPGAGPGAWAWPRAARRRPTGRGATGRHVRDSRHQHLRAAARVHDWRSREASPRACTCARAACRWSPRPARRRRGYRLVRDDAFRRRRQRRRRRSSTGSTCRSPRWRDTRVSARRAARDGARHDRGSRGCGIARPRDARSVGHGARSRGGLDGGARARGPDALDGADRQREVRDRAPAAPEGRATAGRARSCAGTADRRDGERRARRAGPARGCLGRHRESRRGELGVASVTLLGFDGPGACAAGVATPSAPYRCDGGRQHAARRAADGCLLAAAREHGTRHV